MNHPTELTLMLFAEEAMGADMDQSTRALVEEHLGSCDACRRAVSQLRLENQAITRALDSAHEYLPQTLGRFQKPHRLRSFTLATLSAACTAWLVQWSWKSLFEGLIFGGIGWAVSTWMPSVYSLGNQLFLIFQEKGADMLTDYMAFIVAFIALLTLIGLRGVWR
jgi:predicted anti-sigma-YlaC factor YlaD